MTSMLQLLAQEEALCEALAQAKTLGDRQLRTKILAQLQNVRGLLSSRLVPPAPVIIPQIQPFAPNQEEIAKMLERERQVMREVEQVEKQEEIEANRLREKDGHEWRLKPEAEDLPRPAEEKGEDPPAEQAGPIDDVFGDDVVQITCGCSPFRRKQCFQRRGAGGCRIFVTNAELVHLAFDVIQARFRG